MRGDSKQMQMLLFVSETIKARLVPWGKLCAVDCFIFSKQILYILYITANILEFMYDFFFTIVNIFIFHYPAMHNSLLKQIEKQNCKNETNISNAVCVLITNELKKCKIKLSKSNICLHLCDLL